jgi:hypothetical protein
MGIDYLTEDVALQCIVCGGPVTVTGKGARSWKINGSPILTEEGLKRAQLACAPPPAGLGCTAIQSVVMGHAVRAKVAGETPLLQTTIAITNAGGLVKVVLPKSVAAKTGGIYETIAAEKPPEKVHKPGEKGRRELRFRLKDHLGRAVSGEWFRLTLPEGSEAHGVLDATGLGIVAGLSSGTNYKLAFPNLKYVRWFPVGHADTAADVYTAIDGDTLSAIASRNHLPGWKTLWDYAGNVSLRHDRYLPDPVAAGTQVRIPRPDRVLKAGNQEHELRLEQAHPVRTLKFRFVDATTGRSLPDLTVAIHQPDNRTTRMVTDRNGEVGIDGKRGEVFTVTRVIRPGFVGLGNTAFFETLHRRSLDDLLGDTLIGSSDPATRVKYTDRLSGVPKFAAVAARSGAGSDAIHNLPLWDVVIPPGVLNRATNLTCAGQNAHSKHASLVCESIEWNPLSMRLGVNHAELPLDRDYLVRVQSLEGGHVPVWPPKPHPRYGRLASGDVSTLSNGRQWLGNCLWPLEASIDIGFQNVFVYQIDADPSTGKPIVNSLPDDVCRNSRFFASTASGPISAAVGSGTVEVPIVRHRIAVVASLVCNKARNDFEPGEVMDAARLYPIQMLISSLPVDSVAGGIRIVRPRTQLPHHPNLRPYLRSGLFTDNNSLYVPDPTWGRLFAYYDVNSPSGTYTMAHRRVGKDERLEWGSSQESREPRVAGAVTSMMAENLRKLPGQGSFDNIHIAAPMFIDPPPDVPLVGQDKSRASATFADIIMAPFCVHDCLHTHWRWAPHTAKKPQYGWSLTGEPYSLPGAPMVASNQKVTMTVAGSGFHYRAEIERPDPGRWQIIFHHGSGYSVGEATGVFPSAADVRRGLIWLLGRSDMDERLEADSGVWLPPGSSEWPLFYWHLRYCVLLPVHSAFGGVVYPGSFREENLIVRDAALLASAIAG